MQAVIPGHVRTKLAILRLARMLPTLDANPECANVLRYVIAWHESGAPWSPIVWRAARSAAESAFESGAWHARSAAKSAAWSARGFDKLSATWAAESESELGLPATYFEWEAATLLQLLRGNHVTRA